VKSRAALAVMLVTLTAAARAQDPPRWPSDAEQRYNTATRLMQQGRLREAQPIFREVADWPSGGPFREREKALFMSAKLLDDVDDGGARAAYEEFLRRFPTAGVAQVARERLDVLAHDRLEDLALVAALKKGYEDLGNARAALLRHDTDEARPLCLEAIATVGAALDKAPDHPYAARAANLIGEAELYLRRDSSAAHRFRQALALAEREIARTSSPSAKGDADAARDGLARARGEVADEFREETERYVVRGRVAIGAEVLLALLTTASLGARPWRRATRATARLGLIGLAGTIALAVGGALAARFVPGIAGDQERPIAPWEGAILAGPALVGAVVSLSIVTGLGSRRALLAGLAGALAVLAAAVVVIHRLDLMVVLGL
jgi:outer membrane protein assembly factor BamD (BamD/ComL family)